MNWTVDLAVSYVPCPAEHAPAWWAAMKLLQTLTTDASKSRAELLKPDQPTGADQTQSM